MSKKSSSRKRRRGDAYLGEWTQTPVYRVDVEKQLRDITEEDINAALDKIDSAMVAQSAKHWLPAEDPARLQELAGIERGRQCNHTCTDCRCDAPNDCQGEDPERCVRQEHGHGRDALLKEMSNLCRYTGYQDIDLFLEECLETMRAKGHDYRQGNDDDLLHNFRTVGNTVGVDMMKVWFTYFYKHYSAMATFIKEGGQSESEPIEGRIKDQIVYLLLFYRMVKEKKAPIMHHPV